MGSNVGGGTRVSEKRILVLLSGRLVRWPAADGPFARVVCADGGARHALAHGVRPDLIVGDFDSMSEAELDRHELFRGVERRTYPRAKEATDGELAVDAALEFADGAAEIVIAGALGGRLDHTLGNLALLVRIDEAAGGAADSSAPRASVTDGDERVYLLRGRRRDGRGEGDADDRGDRDEYDGKGGGRLVLKGEAGDRLSVLPVSERLTGLSIRGAKWPLDRASVRLGESLTVSNEFGGNRVEISLACGTAWVTTGHPGDGRPGREVAG